MRGTISLANPMNRNHPLNYGCVLWYLSLPGRTGSLKWFDVAKTLPQSLTDGTLTNGPTWGASSRQGGRHHLTFGANMRVAVPDSARNRPSTTSFSVASWFRSSSTAAEQNLWIHYATSAIILRVSVTTGYALWYVTDNSAHNTSLGGTTNLCDGKWHYIQGVVNVGGNSTLYVDGKNIQSTSTTTVDVSTAQVWGIGGWVGGDQSVRGEMDSAKCWIGRSFSDAQALANYREECDGCPSLLNRAGPWRPVASGATARIRRVICTGAV